MDSFNCFSRLPYDIRHQIWSAALTDALHCIHALCIVDYDKRDDGVPDDPVLSLSRRPLSPLSETTITPRRIAATCKESRHITLTLFPDTLEFRHCFTDRPGILRFNSANDVIFVEFYDDALVPFKIKDQGPARQFASIRNLGFDLHDFQSNDLFLLRCFPSLRQLYLVAWDTDSTQFDAIVPACVEEGSDVQEHFSGSETNPERYISFGEHMCPSFDGRNANDLRIVRRERHDKSPFYETLSHLDVKILLRRREGEDDVHTIEE